MLEPVFERDLAFEDHEFYGALGLVAYTSARMFAAIEILIAGMMSKSEGAAVLTVDLSYAQITHLANAIADRTIKGEKEFATLTSILRDASLLNEERNKIIHGEWTETKGGYTCTRWRARGKLVQMQDFYPVGKIFAVAVGLAECRKRLFQFVRRKRFLEQTMFDEQVGVRRLAQRLRARQREQVRIQAQRQKGNQK